MKKHISKLIIMLCITMTICIIPHIANAATSGYYTYSVSNGEATITNCSVGINGHITIPDTLGGYPVTHIGSWAFYGRSGLISVKLPDSVTSIDQYAFSDCSNLMSITLSDNVKDIGDYAFSYCSGLIAATLPDGITSMGENVFSDCSKLISIILPDSLTNIPSYAFYNCGGLTSVSISNNVKTIGRGAFYNCDKIIEIKLGKKLEMIENGAFALCDNLAEITIPKSIAEIQINAFAECPALSQVYYQGSDVEWSEIYIGSGNDSLTSAAITYDQIASVKVTFNANGGTNAPESRLVTENTDYTIPTTVPLYDGHVFLGWSTSPDAAKAEYNSGDSINLKSDDLTLYAVWKKIVSLSTEVINDIFVITPTGVESGNVIILVCYSGDKMVYSDVFTYAGNSVVPFYVNADYDSVKVMAWEDLKSVKPLCSANPIRLAQNEISLLMIE